MWGIVPAAGLGSRIQPLAFSKELLPVGCREDDGTDRPRAVSEYLLERLVLAGANRICFVISPEKFDILQYYGASFGPATLCYVVQPEPAGLCDSIFRALPLIGPEEAVTVGLPDTIWFRSPSFSTQLSRTEAVAFWKSRSRILAPSRIGYGAPSNSRAQFSSSCLSFGAAGSAPTSISAAW
jgi:dTDP-glucose pyrophosphorylase